jgi:membrane-associated protease RseP (regulator of RpoE activity)
MFPAKYTFDINAPPDCTNDFVVFTTGIAVQSVTASTIGTFSTGGTPAGTVTITNGVSSITLTASSTLNTGTNFHVGNNTTTADANSLRDAINRNGASVGVDVFFVGHQFVVRGAEHSGLQQTLFDARWKLPWERSERCGTTGVFQLQHQRRIGRIGHYNVRSSCNFTRAFIGRRKGCLRRDRHSQRSDFEDSALGRR